MLNVAVQDWPTIFSGKWPDVGEVHPVTKVRH
jgi:hypothetical protein